MAKTTTDKIGIDLKGRVNRLKLAERNMLLPLFEAIVNSILPNIILSILYRP